jgi:hypothetical protein
MAHYFVHRRARSERMKQLESTMIRLQADLGPRHRGADSLAAPIIVLAAMERRRQYFRDAIRGTAMLYLDHLVWAIESWDGMCEIERGNHKTNTLRTSRSSTTFGDKAVEDSASTGGRGEALGWRLCARCRSCGATAVTSETCSEVTSKTALNRDDSDKEIKHTGDGGARSTACSSINSKRSHSSLGPSSCDHAGAPLLVLHSSEGVHAWV